MRKKNWLTVPSTLKKKTIAAQGVTRKKGILYRSNAAFVIAGGLGGVGMP